MTPRGENLFGDLKVDILLVTPADHIIEDLEKYKILFSKNY